MNATDTDKM